MQKTEEQDSTRANAHVTSVFVFTLSIKKKKGDVNATLR